ncbi:MAG: hypothetical protein PHX68_02145 [Alphaproteobacteria bacterium]|nr:hypothetical protein [Alphaproteobacteria bacterium]
MTDGDDFEKQRQLVAFLVDACYRNRNPDAGEQAINTALRMGANAEKHPVFLRLLIFHTIMSNDDSLLDRIAGLVPDRLPKQMFALPREKPLEALRKLDERCPNHRPKIERHIVALTQKRYAGSHVAKDIADVPEAPGRIGRHCLTGRGAHDWAPDNLAVLSR